MRRHRVKLTRREQQRLFQDVKKALEKPKLKGTKKLLYEIFETADLLSRVYYFPGKSLGEIQRIREAQEYKLQYNRRKRQLLALKEQKLIDIEQQAEKLEVTLTQKGMLKVIQGLVQMGSRTLPDNQRLYVIFDFPEDVSKTRRRFRYFLKSLGFRMEQFSVWSTDKDVADQLLFYLRQSGVKAVWVQVILGKNFLQPLKK